LGYWYEKTEKVKKFKPDPIITIIISATRRLELNSAAEMIEENW